MANSPDNSPRKRPLRLKSFFDADFIPDDLPKLDNVSSMADVDMWHRTLAALDVGLKQLGLKENVIEDSSIYCSEQYHFARFSGSGSDLVPRLYALSVRVAGIGGTFFPSMQDLRRYLRVTNHNLIYDAARLLVISGFWEVIEVVNGTPTKYRVLGHEQWAEKYGHLGLCCKKRENFPFPTEDELGRKLHGILGGENYHPNVLKGLRNTGASDDKILELATEFMKQDGGNGAGVPRRKRFQQYVAAAMEETK